MYKIDPYADLYTGKICIKNNIDTGYIYVYLDKVSLGLKFRQKTNNMKGSLDITVIFYKSRILFSIISDNIPDYSCQRSYSTTV